MHGAGVLKAGGAFLAMDPNYPKQRLAYMVTDAAAPVLLTHHGLQHRLPYSNSSTQVSSFQTAAWWYRLTCCGLVIDAWSMFTVLQQVVRNNCICTRKTNERVMFQGTHVTFCCAL